MHRYLTFIAFLDLKGAFGSVERITQWVLFIEKAPVELLNLLHPMFSQTYGHLRLYGKLSNLLEMTDSVCEMSDLSVVA